MTANTEALDAARRRTTTIPIVIVGAGVHVGLGTFNRWHGLVATLPEVVNQLETVDEKNLELLKEIRPGIERVGIIHSPKNAASLAAFKDQNEQTAPRLGLVVVPIPVSKPADLDEAFPTIVRERVQALHVHPVPVIFAQRGRIAAFAIERHLPTTSRFPRHGPRWASHVIRFR